MISAIVRTQTTHLTDAPTMDVTSRFPLILDAPATLGVIVIVVVVVDVIGLAHALVAVAVVAPHPAQDLDQGGTVGANPLPDPGPVIVNVDLTVETTANVDLPVETTANAVLAAVESLALVAAVVAVHKEEKNRES